MRMMMDIYQENGYDTREDYLRAVAEDYGLDEELVVSIADLLGEEEDFDGLISAVQDA